MIDEGEVRLAVRRIGDALAADGYVLTVHPGSGMPTFAVAAGPDACADCLVPRDLMASLLVEELERADIHVEGALHLTYPGDAPR